MQSLSGTGNQFAHTTLVTQLKMTANAAPNGHGLVNLFKAPSTAPIASSSINASATVPLNLTAGDVLEYSAGAFDIGQTPAWAAEVSLFDLSGTAEIG